MDGEKKRVLVVGGTGYLGQHLLQEFSDSFDLAFTYHSHLPQLLLHSLPRSLPFRVDLQTGKGFDAVAQSFGQVSDSILSVTSSMESFAPKFAISLVQAMCSCRDC